MYTGINLNETKKHISKNDPDKDNPTVFHLGALDTFVKGHIEDVTVEFDSSVSDEDVKMKILYASRNILTVKFGLRKIENFADCKTKQPVTFEAKETKISGASYLAMPDEVIAQLVHKGLIAELAEEIRKLNSLSEDEAKN